MVGAGGGFFSLFLPFLRTFDEAKFECGAEGRGRCI